MKIPVCIYGARYVTETELNLLKAQFPSHIFSVTVIDQLTEHKAYSLIECPDEAEHVVILNATTEIPSSPYISEVILEVMEHADFVHLDPYNSDCESYSDSKDVPNTLVKHYKTYQTQGVGAVVVSAKFLSLIKKGLKSRKSVSSVVAELTTNGAMRTRVVSPRLFSPKLSTIRPGPDRDFFVTHECFVPDEQVLNTDVNWIKTLLLTMLVVCLVFVATRYLTV